MVAASPLQPRHWVYLDEARSHELHAQVEARPGEAMLLTTEFPSGSRDPAEAIHSARRVTAEAEVAAHLRELEERLSLTGRYFRADARDMRWAPLPPAAGRVDLRGLELPIPDAKQPGARMAFHHFHNPGGTDNLLIAMPRLDADPDRHVLAELTFRFPRVEDGDLSILHSRLTPSTLRSSLVQHHLELPKKGFAKLVEAKDYMQAYGSGWVESTRHVWRAAATRVLGGPRREKGPLLATADQASPGNVGELSQALRAPKVEALRQRFLAAAELAECLTNGEHAIRRIVAAKRRQQPHTAAYDLSILEASLLVEYGMRAKVWSLCDEEGTKLLRYVHGYVRA